jgi:hypothetical protein
MGSVSRLRARRAAAVGGGEEGVSLVEFTLLLPVFLLMLLGMLEFGLAFNHVMAVEYGTREGARTGSALGNGDTTGCGGGNDPAGVDEQIVAAAQRVIKSPGSDVVMSDITELRIFRATATGAQMGTLANVWRYTPGAGPDIDPGPGVDRLDFSPVSVNWPACVRSNAGGNPDSIGVRVQYTYRLTTPLAAVAGMFGGSTLNTMAMTDQTVMALNP